MAKNNSVAGGGLRGLSRRLPTAATTTTTLCVPFLLLLALFTSASPSLHAAAQATTELGIDSKGTTMLTDAISYPLNIVMGPGYNDAPADVSALVFLNKNTITADVTVVGYDETDPQLTPSGRPLLVIGEGLTVTDASFALTGTLPRGSLFQVSRSTFTISSDAPLLRVAAGIQNGTAVSLLHNTVTFSAGSKTALSSLVYLGAQGVSSSSLVLSNNNVTGATAFIATDAGSALVITGGSFVNIVGGTKSFSTGVLSDVQSLVSTANLGVSGASMLVINSFPASAAVPSVFAASAVSAAGGSSIVLQQMEGVAALFSASPALSGFRLNDNSAFSLLGVALTATGFPSGSDGLPTVGTDCEVIGDDATTIGGAAVASLADYTSNGIAATVFVSADTFQNAADGDKCVAPQCARLSTSSIGTAAACAGLTQTACVCTDSATYDAAAGCTAAPLTPDAYAEDARCPQDFCSLCRDGSEKGPGGAAPSDQVSCGGCVAFSLPQNADDDENYPSPAVTLQGNGQCALTDKVTATPVPAEGTQALCQITNCILCEAGNATRCNTCGSEYNIAPDGSACTQKDGAAIVRALGSVAAATVLLLALALLV